MTTNLNVRAAMDSRLFLYWLAALAPFAAFGIVFFSGAGLDVLNIDEAQYAEISREMALSTNWLKVYEMGNDYLDKPPLLFWVSATMFRLFGPTSFAYRLAPILISFFGVYSLWRFVLLYYNRRAAYFAALVWVSSFALAAMNRDVRTDNLLTTFVIFSIWQLSAYLKTDRLKYLIGGSVGIGLSMLAKGPIGLIVPVLAFSGQFLTAGTWRLFFKPAWLIAIAIIGIILTPMCVGLYRQYGGYGLYFYFWLQSFGRITGQNVWDNHAPITFQASNFLWSFQPWVLPFVFALTALVWNQISTLPSYFRLRQNAGFAGAGKETVLSEEAAPGFKVKEHIGVGGFLLTFAALSTSHYQLPHYTFVVFPLAAAVTGVYMDFLAWQKKVSVSFYILAGLQGLIFIGAFFSIGYLLTYSFPDRSPAIIIFGVSAFLIVLKLIFNIFRSGAMAGKRANYLAAAGAVSMFAVGLILNISLFPQIYSYQADAAVGKIIRNNPDIPLDRFIIYSSTQAERKSLDFHALCFNARAFFPYCKSFSNVEFFLKKGENWIYTDKEGVGEFEAKGYKIVYRQPFDKFHVSMLTKSFINPATRAGAADQVYLMEIIQP